MLERVKCGRKNRYALRWPLERSPTLAQAWALMEVKRGNTDQAVRLFKEALTARPGDGAVWQAFALFFKVTGDRGRDRRPGVLSEGAFSRDSSSNPGFQSRLPSFQNPPFPPNCPWSGPWTSWRRLSKRAPHTIGVLSL